MDTALDFWKFAAGLGVFLLGLDFIERSLKELTGARFKRFLRDNTQKPLRAVLTGTLVTAVLQSSSVVTLMLLAFVGAGIISLQNALGVVIGANLGTTFTGWIVATLGFELNLGDSALPAVAVGGLGYVLFSSRRLKDIARFILGFGLLFLGLEYMKDSIGDLAASVDTDMLRSLGPYQLFVVGAVLTAIIQSSSASMVISLTALSAGVISLEGAAGLVIGSDLGTTGTTLLGSLGGTAPKKRVALSHFIFNLVTDAVALTLIGPLLWLIRDGIGVSSDPLTLVFFHSSFNLLGILIFFPILPSFADFLSKRFVTGERPYVNRFLEHCSPQVPAQSIDALQDEVQSMLIQVLLLNLSAFGIRDVLFRVSDEESKLPEYLREGSYQERYERLKRLEGEIVDFFLKLQNQELTPEQSKKVHDLILSVRNATNAAKDVKDIEHNLVEFHRSISDSVIAAHQSLVQYVRDIYLRLDAVLLASDQSALAEELGAITKLNIQHHDNMVHEIYLRLEKRTLSEIETSTLLNVANEIYNANRLLLASIEDLRLQEPAEAAA
ncbi:MAG: Na/Pi cotransporter family protein [Bdellovibrionales bacterium]|nr:Na/Pi cotransporter family protein [Bdellovibrionales bacterium]